MINESPVKSTSTVEDDIGSNFEHFVASYFTMYNMVLRPYTTVTGWRLLKIHLQSLPILL